jgi:hypothetical protein
MSILAVMDYRSAVIHGVVVVMMYPASLTRFFTYNTGV